TGAGMQQTRNNIGILLAPAAIVVVETVDAIKIRPPDGEVARSRVLPGFRAEPAQRTERQIQQPRQTIDAAMDTLREPARRTPGLGREIVPQHSGCQVLRKQNAIAGHEPVRLGQATMGRDKIAPYDAIAVEKNTILSARGQNGAVANFGRAEALVTMPYVFEATPEFGFPPFDECCRGRARAVIGHDDLECRIALPFKRTQNRVER